MKKIIRVFVFLLTALSAKQLVNAQNISVSVNVKPPYSLQPRDYIQQGNNVLITMTNLGSVPVNARLFMSLEGINNSVKIRIKPTYIAPMQLSFGPSETKMMTLNQLKIFNGNPGFNDILFQGYDSKEYFGNGKLPEGMYKVCADVVTAAGPAGGGGGTFSGCGTFLITAYEAPIILNPMNNATIKPLQPQNVFFNWTPSSIAGKTNYTFKLVDLTETPVNNPNDAFQNNVQPFFQQNNIIINSLVYDQSKLKLKEGHKYALQVTAYDQLKNLLYKNNGKSPVTTFLYKNELPLGNNPANQPNQPDQNDAPNGACIAPTKWSGSLNTDGKDGLPNGTQLSIGKFVIKNTVFTKTNGGYDGSGEILVNFLKSKLKVEFKSILVNGENRVYNGVVTARVVNAAVITDAMAKQKSGTIETVPNMNALQDYMDADARNIAKLNADKPATDLPLHIDKNHFTIGIVGLIFEPTEAYINTVLNLPLMTADNDEYLLLSAKAIPVQPNGYGQEAKLWLQKDAEVALSSKLGLGFKAGPDNTFASFDCSGFKQITMNGEVVLSRGIALPLNNSLAVLQQESSKVRIEFKFKNITKQDDLILTTDVGFSNKMSVPDANDFAFDFKNIILDLSVTKNNADFAKAYPDKKDKKDWIGIYIKNVELTLPEGFKEKKGERMSISAENAYIDKMGFSTNLQASGKTFAEGIVASWGITIDSIAFKISQSKLAGAALGGVITLPLGDKAAFDYKASISKGDEKGANVELEIETKDEIEANFFLAKIKLKEGSTITIGKEENKYFAKASLNGELSIDIKEKKEKSNVSKMDIPSIDFEELTIEGRDDIGFVPKLDIKSVSLQNKNGVQAKIGGFELNINDLKFEKHEKEKSVSLSINLGLSLFGGANDQKNGAGAKTKFSIWAKHNGEKYKYEKATLDEIEVNADLGVARLSGSIAIYDEDKVYGNGFRGHVSASLAGLGVGIDVTLQFGKTLEDKGNFKYWYFDAMVDFGKAGLNIPGTAASIYGFGGGAWCNMTRSGGHDVVKPGSFKEEKMEGAAPTKSGVKMVPQKDIAGFKAAVLFGITGSREAFNGDLTFEMELDSKTLSVNHIKLEGNAYLMQNPTNLSRRDPEKAFLYCNAKIEYDAPTRVISGNFGAHVNILNIIQGGGDISFKFDMPDKDKNGNVKPGQHLKWYIKVGQWTPNTDPFEDNARLHADIGFDASVLEVEIRLQGYFMVGNDLPSGLPPLPDAIYAMTESLGAPLKKELPADVSNTQSLAFAFGAGIKLSAGFDIKVISAHLEAAAGFDVLISDLNATCGGKEMGFNGWYAQGQAYAYIDGNFKVLGATVAQISAGAVFQVKLPNPTWVRGDVYFYLNILHIIDAHFSKTIEKGSLCENMQTDINPFEATKLIKNVSPANKATKINPMGTEMKVDFTYGEYEAIKIYNAFTESYDSYFPRNQIMILDKNKKELNKSDYGISEISKGRSCNIQMNKTMEANTDYYIYVKAEIQGEKTEEVYAKFTTGDRPAKFGMKDLVESYPLPNQRFFMRQKVDGTPVRGFLHLKQDLSYLFEKGDVYILFLDQANHLAGYAKASAAVQNEYDAQSSSKVYFDIPKELKSSTIYQIKLLGNDPNANKGNNVNAFGSVMFEGFYFRTSRYNNFQEKLNTFKVVKTGYIHHIINVNFVDYKTSDTKKAVNDFYVPVVMMQGGEELDGYEMFGYKSTFNNYESTKGCLLFPERVYSGTWGANYLTNQNDRYMRMTYAREFDKNVLLIPELNKDEANFMHTLSDAVAYKAGSRPQGFPFEGAVKEKLFAGGPEMFWMKNIQHYESLLKNAGTLSANETITGPEGPLTADEINGGGGFMNNNLGLKGNGGAEQKKYYALMDYTPFIAAWDHMIWLNAVLKEAKNVDIWRAYRLTEKMGLPVHMPKGTQNFQIRGEYGKVSLFYNYYPPL